MKLVSGVYCALSSHSEGSILQLAIAFDTRDFKTLASVGNA